MNEAALLRDGGYNFNTLVVANDDVVWAWGLVNVAIPRFPGLKLASTATPLFGTMSTEDEAHTSAIFDVERSTPKQEYWMLDHVERILGATLIGLRAAVNFYVGDVKRAPERMHRRGLEWIHRLASEPRPLWRCYLLLAPMFVRMAGRREL